jgi:TetR/AcrR family transcriptional repressor of bet genes
MPKLGMQPIRRRQLIDATLDAINEVGMHDATIAQIARRAGVSTGIISHYFKDKNGLLEATMRDITGQLRRGVEPSARPAGRQRRAAPAGDCRRQL